MKDKATRKKNTLSQPQGNRNKGRPKIKCLVAVLKNSDLKVSACLKTAQDRHLRRIAIKDARLQKVCNARQEGLLCGDSYTLANGIHMSSRIIQMWAPRENDMKNTHGLFTVAWHEMCVCLPPPVLITIQPSLTMQYFQQTVIFHCWN